MFQSIVISGQNTITIKKSYPTISAIFKSKTTNGKVNQYYCFKKSGYVYFFSSPLKEKKIIHNCREKDWLKMNSSQGKYIFNQDTVTISPITYTMYGEESNNDFFYIGLLDSSQLKVNAIGNETKKEFKLLYPIPIVYNQKEIKP